MSMPPFILPMMSPSSSRRNSFSDIDTRWFPADNDEPPQAPQDLGSEFLWKYGKRHHRHLPDKVPWPMAYDPDYLYTEELEATWNGSLGHPVTWMDRRDNPPRRLLDVGCGCGAWALHAAEEWPDCEVIGFDLVDVQAPLKYVPAAKNVTWVHGNFLSNRLPFEEDSFDYVHMSFVEKGVPETKWGSLFEEIVRVLRPGGAIEFVTEDIIFPLLPPWFTEALHKPAARAGPVTNNQEQGQPEHGHALLESLFYSVFERRFINLKPTSSITGYFTSYFVNTFEPPARKFPMPPFRLPPRQGMSERGALGALPMATSRSMQGSEHSAKSTSYESSTTLTDDTASMGSGLEPSLGGSSLSETLLEDDPFSDYGANDEPWSRKFVGFPSRLDEPIQPIRNVKSQEDWSRLTDMEEVILDDEFSLSPAIHSLHLWRAIQNVLACREAMWEELESRLAARPDELVRLGWKRYSGDFPSKGERESNRAQFEELMAQYTRDMDIRLAWGNSLEDIGWAWPTEDPPTKAEHYQQERLYTAFSEAQRRGLDTAERTAWCRSVRAMFGFKGNVELAHE